MKTTYCNFLGRQDKSGAIKIKPLGKARNKVRKPTLPGWQGVVTELVIDRKYARGLDGIEDYSHVVVVYWMGQEKE